jgi:hypothetical protein
VYPARWSLTVFEITGVRGHRRERIEAALVAVGKHAHGPAEAWIAWDGYARDRPAGTILQPLGAVTCMHSSVGAATICPEHAAQMRV